MFNVHKHDTGARQPWEYLPAAAGTYKAGMALTVTGGQLAPISAAMKTTPPYICMADVTVEEGQNIPVIRVESDYNEEDVEQLRIRVEAFIELIKYGKG